MQMKGTRKFSDVAKEALERPLSDKFENGVSHVDVKKIFEYIVKKVDYKWRFEWNRKKGSRWGHRVWDMESFEKSVLGKRGMFVVCGKAKRGNEALCRSEG